MRSVREVFQICPKIVFGPFLVTFERGDLAKKGAKEGVIMCQ